MGKIWLEQKNQKLFIIAKFVDIHYIILVLDAENRNPSWFKQMILISVASNELCHKVQGLQYTRDIR